MFTKTREVEFIPAFLISISSSYIILIAFHLHDRTVWIIIIVHVHWTTLESASIYYKREDKVVCLKVKSAIKHMGASKKFQSWSSTLDPQIKKKKLFTRESSQQAKEENKIFLGFLKLDRHMKRKREK